MSLFYGFIHQGGVYPATAYLSADMKLTPLTTDIHVVTSHIYSLPESFFMQKPSNKIYSQGKVQYVVDRRVYLYEEGSKDLEYIMVLLRSILKTKEINPKKKIKVYLLIPSSLSNDLNYLLGKNYLNLYLVESFFPHLSTEAFPDLSKYLVDLSGFSYAEDIISLIKGYFFELFKLCLYEVSIATM